MYSKYKRDQALSQKVKELNLDHVPTNGKLNFQDLKNLEA